MLETPFAEQRAVYRRLRGGKHAPVLAVCGSDPRFEPLPEERAKAAAAEAAQRVGNAIEIRISNTFVAVSSGMMRVERRKSWPKI